MKVATDPAFVTLPSSTAGAAKGEGVEQRGLLDAEHRAS
jgi:hypothetical protein